MVAMIALGGVLSEALLISRGVLALDLGWGRSHHPLGPFDTWIDAPRDVVFEQIASPYLGRMPAAMRGKIEIIERSDDLVVARHRTTLPILDAVTVETVRFEPPTRVTFRLLRGPVPHVEEEFVLDEEGRGTRFTYRGTLAADLWALGRLYGGRIVAPTWERVVRSSMDEIKRASERRAAAQRRRAGTAPTEKGR